MKLFQFLPLHGFEHVLAVLLLCCPHCSNALGFSDKHKLGPTLRLHRRQAMSMTSAEKVSVPYWLLIGIQYFVWPGALASDDRVHRCRPLFLLGGGEFEAQSRLPSNVS